MWRLARACYEAQVREIALRQCLEEAKREDDEARRHYGEDDDGPLAA